MGGGRVPAEALATLKRRLAALPPRHPDRKEMMASTCRLYAVSRATLYRALRGEHRPRDAHRSDRGHARVMGDGEIEHWCEIVSAVKKSTTNRSMGSTRPMAIASSRPGCSPSRPSTDICAGSGMTTRA